MKRDGFTLIEILVVVGVLSIAATFVSNILVSTFQSYNKADVVNFLEQNGNYALSLMEQRLRNARKVVGGVEVGVGETCFKEVDLTTHGGGKEAFAFLSSEGGNGFIGYDQAGFNPGEADAITDFVGEDAADVKFNADQCRGGVCECEDDECGDGCSWFKIAEAPGGQGTAVVTIQLHLRQSVDAPSREDYQAQTTLKTSVVVRAY